MGFQASSVSTTTAVSDLTNTVHGNRHLAPQPGSGNSCDFFDAPRPRVIRIRPESLKRIEQGHVSPSVRTVEKIDQALREAEEE
jgi:hypothetical protein